MSRMVFLIVVFVFGAGSVFSQSTTQNYVVSHKLREPYTTIANPFTLPDSATYTSIDYVDGLGRPIQNVKRRSSVGGKDIITPIQYDLFGRNVREYLPYYSDSTAQTGSFRPNAVSNLESRSNAIYGDAYPYSENQFESSPLNRINKKSAPGTPWQMGSGKEVKFERRTNTLADDVRIWTLNPAGLPLTNAIYQANTLWVEITKDEDNIQTLQYTDKLGRVVLKKTEGCLIPTTDGHMGWLNTYYVYDDIGQLRAVIPPLAVDIFEVNDAWSMSADSDLAYEQYFLYTYDGRGRMTTKKVPGKKPEYMLYDLQDRLVGIQDGEMRQSNKWLYTRYDGIGRVLSTGMASKSQAFGTLQSELNAAGANNASITTGGIITGGWPSEEGELLTINYFDSYTHLSGKTYDVDAGSVFDVASSSRVHGLLTGKKVKNLETGEFYTTVMFYDDKGRVIQTVSDHQKGGELRMSTKYNFEDQPTHILTRSTQTGVEDILRRYTYNVIGQLDSLIHQVGSETARKMVKNTYNDLGQLTTKAFPEITSGNQTYSYNIRGWLKGLGTTLPDGFTQKNYYNDPEATNPRWNGNISRIDWEGKAGISGTFKTRTYNYVYDRANRLKTANFSASSETNWFTVSNITYDANGNIYSLVRSNQRALGTYGTVDDLQYEYGMFSNRLSQVKDNNTSTAYTSKDFEERSTTEYGYDENGNQTSNRDKNIDLITYNHLNLPVEVSFTTGAKIRFAYDAEGRKLSQKVYNTSGALTKTQDYIGEIVLLDGVPDYLIHEEGRIVIEGAELWAEYYLKDHLGNIRQVLRAPTSQTYVATLETGDAVIEEQQFTMLAASRQTEPEHNVTVGGSQVAWLNADRGRMVGPGRSQEIYRGDSMRLQVHGKYLDDNTKKANAGSFVSQSAKDRLISDLNELATSTQRAGTGNPIALFNLANILAGDFQKKQSPEAYLIYALYDQDSNRYEVGKQVLSRSAANQHEVLEENLYIEKDGYMETFVVNETGEDVWFDNLMVMSTTPTIVQETHYDPWGLELTGLGFQYGGIKANKYLYQGKELMDDLNLNIYDFEARGYDPVIGRTWQQDPMSEMFYSLSPYSWAANNPMRFIDPSGMVIEDGSKKEWEKQKGYVENRRDNLQGRVDRLSAKAEAKGWSSEKLASKTGNLTERVSSLNSSLETMGTLEASSQVYSLSRAVQGENGGVTLNTETSAINISFGSTANFVHEAAHAGQFETGDIAFDSKTGTTLGQDIYDEISAYKAQFAYDPSSVSRLPSTSAANSFGAITPQWVQGLAGGTLYGPGGSANTGISPLNINSTRPDFIKAYPNNPAMKSLPANFMLKKSYPSIYYKQ